MLAFQLPALTVLSVRESRAARLSGRWCSAHLASSKSNIINIIIMIIIKIIVLIIIMIKHDDNSNNNIHNDNRESPPEPCPVVNRDSVGRSDKSFRQPTFRNFT